VATTEGGWASTQHLPDVLFFSRLLSTHQSIHHATLKVIQKLLQEIQKQLQEIQKLLQEIQKLPYIIQKLLQIIQTSCPEAHRSHGCDVSEASEARH
jgi:hypothetical protein